MSVSQNRRSLLLGKADWIYNDDLGCHIPCCIQQVQFFVRCGNGPLEGEQITTGDCGLFHSLSEAYAQDRT